MFPGGLPDQICTHHACSHHICRFELMTALDSSCTVVSIQELSTGTKFQKRIPAEYHPHLTWIKIESTGSLQRSRWLQNVLDCFVDELRPVSEFPASWRSTTLNSLLVRAFYRLPDEDPKAINDGFYDIMGLGWTPRLTDWNLFYSGFDVVGEAHLGKWEEVKPGHFGQHRDDDQAVTSNMPAEQDPGVAI